MPISAAVDQLLRQRNLPYEEVSAAERTPRIVASTLLHDGREQLLALYPSDTLLDLNAVCRQVGRQWRAQPPAELRQICARHGLTAVPAVPTLLALPLLVDQRLLESPTICFPADDSALVRVRTEAFRANLDGAVIADVAVPLAAVPGTPMEITDDVQQIGRAVANFTQLRMTQRLEETLEIAPLPPTAERIIRLRADPFAATRQLTDVVETDPALAAQVISWAASPYYAAPGNVQSVYDAIARVLGFDLVLNLALGLSLGKTLVLPPDSPHGFTPYWHQAVYTATAVEALTGAMPAARRPSVGLAYLTGLLHNFGYLLLAEIFPPHFALCCRYQEANPAVGYAPIERHLLGTTRDQLAGWLMRLWSMPDEVGAGVRFQSEPDYAGEHHRYAHLVLVAKRLLRLHGIGDGPLLPVPEAVYERLGISQAEALQAIQQVVDAGDVLHGLADNLASD